MTEVAQPMNRPLPLTERGSYLPNVHTVYFHGATPWQDVYGVFLWPNGYVTVYRSSNVNEGTIFPPGEIRQLDFGSKS